MSKKLITFVLTMIMVFSFAATSFAANGEIGVVNVPVVLQQYPGFEDITRQIMSEKNRLQKELQTQIKGKDAKEQQRLTIQLNQDFAKFERNKMAPVDKRIRAAIAQAAKTNGIKNVFGGGLLYGGRDLTKEVIAIIKGDSAE